MENTYGIGVKNRYEVFYKDDEDPLEILRQQEEEKERKKAEKLQSKDKPKPAKGNKVIAPPAKKNIKETPNVKVQEAPPIRKDDKPKAPRQTDKTVKFGPSPNADQKDLEERKNRRNKEDRPPPPAHTTEFRDRGDEGIRGRGRGRGGRGRGRGRGAGNGGGGYDNRGKREFDRQSGSDRSSVKPMEKREGGGAHNWGTVKDDLEMQLHPMSGDENQEVAERSGDEATLEAEQKEGEAPSEEVKEPTEEGPREMTLDEWKREQENKRSVPKFNLRKPGEGEDQAQWKKLYQLKKKMEEEEEEDDESDEDDEEYVRRGRQKHLVDIEINFSDSRRGRGRGRGRGTGRGGPGGGRGGSGGGVGSGVGIGGNSSGNNVSNMATGGSTGGPSRGPPKNAKSAPSAPRVDDWNDFPSLVTA